MKKLQVIEFYEKLVIGYSIGLTNSPCWLSEDRAWNMVCFGLN